MNAVSATIQALLADSSITNIVGQRVEPITARQGNPLPDIIVNQITNMDEFLLSGQGQYPSVRVRIECRAETRTEVLTLGDAIISRLRDLSGTFAGMEVKSFLQEENDETEQTEEFNYYRRITDFSVRLRVA